MRTFWQTTAEIVRLHQKPVGSLFGKQRLYACICTEGDRVCKSLASLISFRVNPVCVYRHGYTRIVETGKTHQTARIRGKFHAVVFRHHIKVNAGEARTWQLIRLQMRDSYRWKLCIRIGRQAYTTACLCMKLSRAREYRLTPRTEWRYSS